MENKIKYSLTLLSDWHASSGLSGGAATDIITLKDEQGVPYLPGKTVKGLFREALEEIAEVQSDNCTNQDIERILGKRVSEKHDENKNIKENDFGTDSHFSNAVLPIQEQKELVSNGLEAYLYRNLSSTTIDKKGLAKHKSLRAMEVCMPITLEGCIKGVSDEDKELLEMAAKWTRQLGMKRNRGFGKCKFEIKK